MESTLKDENDHAYTELQNNHTDASLNDKYILQNLFMAESSEPFNPFVSKTPQKNDISAFCDRSKSGILEDFRLMYPKVLIKFVIPPLYKNLMLDWTAVGETRLKNTTCP